MSTAIYTVVHSSNIQYIIDFFYSLNTQSDNDFKLFIGTDNVVINDKIDKYNFDYKTLSFKADNIFNSRLEHFHYIKSSGFKCLIFVDADDILNSNAILRFKEVLQNNIFACSDINILDENANIISSNYWMNTHNSLNINDIYDKNIIGLGNSAIRLDEVELPAIIPNDIIAMDWYLYSLIIKNNTIQFINDIPLGYRQYPSSLTELIKINYSKLQKCINVKKSHYKNLLQFSNIYEPYLENILIFEKKIIDIDYANSYLKKIKNLNKNMYWWEDTNFDTL